MASAIVLSFLCAFVLLLFVLLFVFDMRVPSVVRFFEAWLLPSARTSAPVKPHPPKIWGEFHRK
jgi:hypothetical protein